MRHFLYLIFVLCSCSETKYNTTSPHSPPATAAPIASTVPIPAITPILQNKQSSDAHVSAASEHLPELAESKKFFSVAVLTRGVKCLFCHMRIEGDVGGIQFPEDSEMHARSGEALRILGTLFATNRVPEKLNTRLISNEVRSNYKNSELKIFPTSKDEKGETVFPQITAEMLNGKAIGRLSLGSLKLKDSYLGNLTLVAKDDVLEVNGEFFVDGDVILGGPYRGTGTIYARNIFIVRDLYAKNSPFPYSSDPIEAKAKAEVDILEKRDGLYLLSLGQITVGFPDSAFHKRKSEWRAENPASFGITRENPFIQIDKYIALAQQKSCTVSNDPRHSSEYAAVLVNQVDAFLYASDYLLWRTCGGYTLNGGFATPSVALVNANDVAAGQSKDDEPVNVVRYDYRLRAGVQAFSVLREFFENE